MSDVAEFDVIRKYFTPVSLDNDVILGVGDDCAVLQAPADKQLVMTVDTLVSGVHFPVSTSAADIAHKTAAVNLSDLAAMGAKPAWAMLALTLPDIDEDWIQEFSSSLLNVLSVYGVKLIGGDTTQGPLTISLQLTGFVEPGLAMKRNAAEAGDLIFVSGTLGDAALGLAMLEQSDIEGFDNILHRLNRPTPRIELGLSLAEYCSCAIDISDGLLADLGHILEASQCGATIYIDSLPASEGFIQFYAKRDEAPECELMLRGGDDYELCFTINPAEEKNILRLADELGVKLSCIGRIEQNTGLQLIGADGKSQQVKAEGFQHFMVK